MTALAATTASFTPASVKVATGQQFNVSVTVNPQTTKDYAEKIEVNFPADVLEVTSFTMGSGGMALSQPGYDSIDNANGVLIKTAGYAGGISSPTAFGTILFTAKKAGSGTITIGGQSASFQASGQGAITGTGSSFIVSTLTVTPSKSAAAALAPVTTINGQTIGTTTAQQAAAALADYQAAAAGSTGSNYMTYVIILIIVVIVIAGYFIWKKTSKKQ